MFTPDEITAQHFGIYSQNDWTDSIDKMELVDDAAEIFDVSQAVSLADLAKQAEIQAQYSQLQSQNTNYFNKLFFIEKEFTLPHLEWLDLINRNYVKESFI